MDATVLLVEPVHLVEQRRNLLDFVDHHPVAAAQGSHELLEAGGVAAQRQESRRIEQVDRQGLRKRPGEPGRFARAARAEQEKRLGGSGDRAGEVRRWSLVEVSSTAR